tara:strand:- start:620 stop:1144 length:525 start_codon:yes stop_codon:yes gene_type:complete
MGDQWDTFDTTYDQGDLFYGNKPSLYELRKQAQLPIKECPCCGASNKVYKRKLSSTMTATMCAISATDEEGGWVHLNRVPRRFVHGGEVAQLQHWELLEQKRNDNTRKRRSGVWRLTPKGYAFVRGELRVPSHAFVCSPGDRLLGWETTTTGVVEALGDHFDYQELMLTDWQSF